MNRTQHNQSNQTNPTPLPLIMHASLLLPREKKKTRGSPRPARPTHTAGIFSFVFILASYHMCTTSHRISSDHITSYLYTIYHRITSHHISSYRIRSDQIRSYHIVSDHIISDHITSHHTDASFFLIVRGFVYHTIKKKIHAVVDIFRRRCRHQGRKRSGCRSHSVAANRRRSWSESRRRFGSASEMLKRFSTETPKRFESGARAPPPRWRCRQG